MAHSAGAALAHPAVGGLGAAPRLAVFAQLVATVAAGLVLGLARAIQTTWVGVARSPLLLLGDERRDLGGRPITAARPRRELGLRAARGVRNLRGVEPITPLPALSPRVWHAGAGRATLPCPVAARVAAVGIGVTRASIRASTLAPASGYSRHVCNAAAVRPQSRRIRWCARHSHSRDGGSWHRRAVCCEPLEPSTWAPAPCIASVITGSDGANHTNNVI